METTQPTHAAALANVILAIVTLVVGVILVALGDRDVGNILVGTASGAGLGAGATLVVGRQVVKANNNGGPSLPYTPPKTP